MNLYSFISGIFGIVVVISNLISTKMLLLPFLQNFMIPAGLITYPLTFLISDFVTEVYGAKKAKEMIYYAFGMSLLAYLILQVALQLPPADPEYQRHFEEVLGLNGLLLTASLIAYVSGQILDVQLYAFIKEKTGPRYVWMRNNGSTWGAQLLDTIVVNVLYFKVGLGWNMGDILPIMLFSYLYKCSFSVTCTPLFYFLLFLLRKFGNHTDKKLSSSLSAR
jgi:uncharacterized integral membrane protein (TIGR00697 family)